MSIAKQLTGRERTALVFCVAFMMATLVLSTFDQRSIVHTVRSSIDPNYQDVRYTGTIVQPARASGQCRFTQFDNRTIEFMGSGIGDCFNNRNPYSPNERLNSLRDAFKK